MNSIDRYQTKRQESDNINQLLYLFESVGENNILKVIVYSYVIKFQDRNVYNLGFGDYDEKSGEVYDDVNSNNNDMYKVFNTILYSIVDFFEKFPNDAISVQGSDSIESFVPKCKMSCTKNCKDDKCKNFNRRIRIYKNFVDKNFNELCQDYIFFGSEDNSNDFVQYLPSKNYISILVYKKK